MNKKYYHCKYTPFGDHHEYDSEEIIVLAASEDIARRAAQKEFYIGDKFIKYIEVNEIEVIEV